ncbi:MAG: hypothetical protein DWQ04_01205 [Chloroflexi bacterium]|nr:MAG: hypothetical protein DWQ04_01205 [Chloroflexota bacterium]
MSQDLNKIILESIPSQQKANELMDNLFEITKPTAVYSQPITQGDYTVITASELQAGIGYGYGGGGGINNSESEEEPVGNIGSGGGGGGGGGTSARPVAAIIIGPNGVRVEPIIDPTKIGIAFFTVLGGIFMTAAKVRKYMAEGKLD